MRKRNRSTTGLEAIRITDLVLARHHQHRHLVALPDHPVEAGDLCLRTRYHQRSFSTGFLEAAAWAEDLSVELQTSPKVINANRISRRLRYRPSIRFQSRWWPRFQSTPIWRWPAKAKAPRSKRQRRRSTPSKRNVCTIEPATAINPVRATSSVIHFLFINTQRTFTSLRLAGTAKRYATNNTSLENRLLFKPSRGRRLQQSKFSRSR